MIFDLDISWGSLANFPIDRLVKGGSICIYLTPPNEIRNAVTLLETWGLQLLTTINVRGEDAITYVGLVAGFEVDKAPDFGAKPGDIYSVQLRKLMNDLGDGIALFTSRVPPSGWDWWEPDNVASTVDLWDYPFRPRNFKVDEAVVKYAALLRSYFVELNKLYWKIGDLIAEIDKAGYKWRSIYAAMGLTNKIFTHRWAWDVMRIAKQYPEPVRDYSRSFSDYRVKHREALKRD